MYSGFRIPRQWGIPTQWGILTVSNLFGHYRLNLGHLSFSHSPTWSLSCLLTFRNFDPTQTEPGCTKHTFINEICWRRLVDMLQGHRNPFLKWQKIGKYFGPLFCPTLVLGLSKLTFKAPLLLYFRGLYQGQTPETAKSPFSSFSWWSRSPLLYYIVYCYPTIITQLCIKCKIYSQNTLNREKRATLNF